MKLFIKITAIFLIIYGVIGAIIFFVSIYPLWRYNLDLNSVLTGMQTPVEKQFKSMSDTMGDASIATTNAANSIRTAKIALHTGSDFTSSSGNALYTISDYVGFTVVGGWRPFSSAYKYFQDSGNNLKSLSSQLKQTANSLEVNAQDMDRLSGDFKDMSTKLNEVSTKFTQTTSIPHWRIIQTKNILTGILIWLGVIHIFIIIIGINFLQLKNKI